jgi:hypothetical protein
MKPTLPGSSDSLATSPVLLQEVQVLRKKNLELRQINEELQEALRKNSSDSHKPLSSDLSKRKLRRRTWVDTSGLLRNKYRSITCEKAILSKQRRPKS